MTRDDIIALAQEAVIAFPNENPFDFRLCRIETVERFAALVAAAEREACAKENAELLQALQNLHQRCHWADAPEEMDAAKAAIDKAIRARGEA